MKQFNPHMHRETFLGCQPNVYLSFTCTVSEEVTSELLKLLFLKRNKAFTFFITYVVNGFIMYI